MLTALQQPRKATASELWTQMPKARSDVLPQMKRDYQALALANSLDPKRFMKGSTKLNKVPETFAVSRIQDRYRSQSAYHRRIDWTNNRPTEASPRYDSCSRPAVQARSDCSGYCPRRGCWKYSEEKVWRSAVQEDGEWPRKGLAETDQVVTSERHDCQIRPIPS